jgi:hypothetical protein
MREQPRLFDELYVSITEVGESAGTLDFALEQLADFKERSAALKNRVVTALTYPAVVLVMAVGVAVLLMTMVVPNLLATLAESGAPAPVADPGSGERGQRRPARQVVVADRGGRCRRRRRGQPARTRPRAGPAGTGYS